MTFPPPDRRLSAPAGAFIRRGYGGASPLNTIRYISIFCYDPYIVIPGSRAVSGAGRAPETRARSAFPPRRSIFSFPCDHDTVKLYQSCIKVRAFSKSLQKIYNSLSFHPIWRFSSLYIRRRGKHIWLHPAADFSFFSENLPCPPDAGADAYTKRRSGKVRFSPHSCSAR